MGREWTSAAWSMRSSAGRNQIRQSGSQSGRSSSADRPGSLWMEHSEVRIKDGGIPGMTGRIAGGARGEHGSRYRAGRWSTFALEPGIY